MAVDGGRHSGVVGREPEFALLRRALDVAVRRGFRALVVEGRAGIGKTTLWDWALGEAAQRSWRVVSDPVPRPRRRRLDHLWSWPTCWPAFPMWPTRGSRSRSAGRSRSRSSAPGRDAASWRSAPSPPGSCRSSKGSPPPEIAVLVAVDDAQWLDGPSAALLEFAARRLRAQPVLFLLSQRSGDPEPFPYERACAELGRLELGPLDLAELQQLIRARLDAPLPRRQLVEVERLSGGNPLFALELARAFQGQVDRASGPPPLPSTLAEALLARIRSLSRPARRSLLVAALAAEPRAGFADSLGLAQAEAAALVAVTGPDDVGGVHRTRWSAWAVERSATQAERRAAHLELAVQRRRPRRGDPAPRPRRRGARIPELAAELERAAARGADPGRAGGGDRAPRRRAAPLPGGSISTPDRAWSRAEIPLQLGGAATGPQAWELGQEALARLPPGPARAALLLEAVEHRPGSDDLCRQALTEAGDDPGLRIRGELALALQRLYGFDGTGARPHVETAVELARRLGSPQLLDLAVTHRGIVTFLFGDGDPSSDFAEALAIEAELGDRLLPVAMSASCYWALWLMCTGGLDPAHGPSSRSCSAWRSMAATRAARRSWRSFLGALEMRAGNWSPAREQIESAARLADLMEFAQGSAEKRGWLALLLARQGELQAAEAAAAEAMAVSASIGDRFAQVLVLEARATAAAGLDDAAGVMRAGRPIHEILSAPARSAGLDRVRGRRARGARRALGRAGRGRGPSGLVQAAPGRPPDPRPRALGRPGHELASRPRTAISRRALGALRDALAAPRRRPPRSSTRARCSCAVRSSAGLDAGPPPGPAWRRRRRYSSGSALTSGPSEHAPSSTASALPAPRQA